MYTIHWLYISCEIQYLKIYHKFYKVYNLCRIYQMYWISEMKHNIYNEYVRYMINFISNIYHSGPKGSLSQQKLIIYMSYIFKKVMKNAIQIHWNQNRALREFNVMDIYFHLYYGHPQWILRIGEVFPHLYSKLKKYPHSVIYFLKGIIEAYLNM